MKKKFKLEDYPGDYYAMHCPEEWQAKIFCKYLNDNDLKWNNGESYLDKTRWGTWGFDSVYCFNEGAVEDLKRVLKVRRILSFSDFDWPEMHKPLKRDISFGIPVHDLVYRPTVAEHTEPPHDDVNHPLHYTYGKIEVIDFIEDKKLGFARGNAVKYICRAGKKNPDKEIEDLEKAIWYIQREIKMLGGAE